MPKVVLNQIEETFRQSSSQETGCAGIPKEKPIKGVQEKIVRIPRAKAHVALGIHWQLIFRSGPVLA